MKSNNEQGHGINLANFDILLDDVEVFGTDYKPNRIDLTTANARILQDKCKVANEELIAAEAADKKATNERLLVFDVMKSILTNIAAEVDASAMTKKEKTDVHALIRKLRGSKAISTIKRIANLVAKRTIDPQENQDTPLPDGISSAQTSYESLALNFDRLIQLLTVTTGYGSNNPNLTTTGLTTLLNSLRQHNANVAKVQAKTKELRYKRDELFYKENTGLIDTALSIKKAVQSSFGRDSVQYKTISGIPFKKRKY